MNDGGFEWDERKAADNYARHGVSFTAARDVFKDPVAIEQLDDRPMARIALLSLAWWTADCFLSPTP